MKQTATKALTAAAIAFASLCGNDLQTGSISTKELLIAAGAGIVAGVATWRVPNQTVVTDGAGDGLS